MGLRLKVWRRIAQGRAASPGPRYTRMTRVTDREFGQIDKTSRSRVEKFVSASLAR